MCVEQESDGHSRKRMEAVSKFPINDGSAFSSSKRERTAAHQLSKIETKTPLQNVIFYQRNETFVKQRRRQYPFRRRTN